MDKNTFVRGLTGLFADAAHWALVKRLEEQPQEQAALLAAARQHGYTDERLQAAVQSVFKSNDIVQAEQVGYVIGLKGADLAKIREEFADFPSLMSAVATVVVERGNGKASAYLVGYTTDGRAHINAITKEAGKENRIDATDDSAAVIARVAKIQKVLQQHATKLTLADKRRFVRSDQVVSKPRTPRS